MTDEIKEVVTLVKKILGKRVNYIRVAVDPQTGVAQNVEGEATLAGFFIHLDGHLQVRVVDGNTQINIDEPALNAKPEDKKKYFDHVHQLHARAAKINEDNKALVMKGNAEIEALNKAFLGDPIKIETSEANDNKPDVH